jgi:hypothetical protein
MEMQTITEITIAYPKADERHLWISVGACQLKLAPSQEDVWIVGSYDDPSGAVPCKIVEDGGLARITQGYHWPEMSVSWDHPPRFDLALGKTRAFALTLELGASESAIDLGGVPISRLTGRLGAGKYAIDFSVPNPEPMSVLEVTAGAGEMELTRLANANATEMQLEGGAAGYMFDFGGVLQRDMQVWVRTGLAAVEIRVPATTAAKIVSESLLGGLEVEDFVRRDNAFLTEPALAGATPLLTIHTSVALGSLRLVTTE